MGSPSVPEIRCHPFLPNTPPDLASPGASSFSSRSSPSEERAWAIHPIPSLSMPKYDGAQTSKKAVVQRMEGGRHHPELRERSGPRQQLPSLSSIFGPPAAVLPFQSPVSDYPGSYPLHSPLDRRRLSSSHSNAQQSYFPQAMPHSDPQQRHHNDPRLQGEHQRLQAASQSFCESTSHKRHGIDLDRPISQQDKDTKVNGLVKHEAPRSELAFVGPEAKYRSSQDTFNLRFPGSKDMVVDPQSRERMQDGSTSPLNRTNSISVNGILIRDGLGPKIWTGTHFLPRFVRAAEVSGEGTCYFYDDGSHCKTVIDGEAVNAHWGVTKAGKPRKRLAIACMTCREKKIKCDPDFPRCVQCEKFGRICKFKNA